jgi:hypothetical protein
VRVRILVVGIVAICILALLAPTGAVSNGGSRVLEALGLAKRAEKDARRALRQARSAKRLARRKARRGPRGRRGATGPQGPAGARGATGPRGPAGQAPALRFASAPGSVSTTSDEYEALAGGPSLTATVPQSGFIEVIAQVATPDTSDEVAVGLFEDGAFVSGQATECGGPTSGTLFTTPGGGLGGTYGTPASFGGISCSSTGAPGPVLFQRPPGTHTYELRYAVCCPPGTAEVSDRKLWIGPRP